MRNYVLSGYIFGVVWGLGYGAFRWELPHDLAMWQIISIVVLGSFTLAGLIGALAGLIAGLALRQHQRVKLKGREEPKHQQ